MAYQRRFACRKAGGNMLKFRFSKSHDKLDFDFHCDFNKIISVIAGGSLLEVIRYLSM
ncbi:MULTISPECIES: hypothetical protein [Bacillus cereus group]|uniref:hypothetical protein n=1 Tax=Bacillus cereus group TaxID=86661 RepID=UPI0015D488AF|nr:MULTISPECIES: hypothetical protein [Bacillus cereus group]MED2615402.1 hypothetical protein [Bacillus toyonensis]